LSLFRWNSFQGSGQKMTIVRTSYSGRSLRSLLVAGGGAAAVLAWSAAASAQQATCPARPPAVAIGGAASGDLASSDGRRDDRLTDCFRLPLRQGDSIQVDLIASQFDPFLDVIAPGGGDSALKENDDAPGGGRNARLNFIAPATGDYLLRAQGLSGGTGSYVLSVTRREMAPPSPSLPLAAGREIQGHLDDKSPKTDDGHPYALYGFQGQAGSRIRIDMTSETLDSVVELKREDGGDFSATNDDGGEGRNARLWVVLPASGRYLLQARSLGEEAGDYSLKLTEYGPAGPPPAPAALSRGAPVQGRLSFEDSGLQSETNDSGAISYFYRLYALPMRAGETVTVEMKSSDFDPVLDAGVMSLLGFASARSNDDSDGTNAKLVLTPTESGTVYLRARSLNAEKLGDFTLTATQGPSGRD
jgi:hypothetical protein